MQGMPVSSFNTTAAAGGMAGPLASSSNANANGIPGLSPFQSMVYSIIQVFISDFLKIAIINLQKLFSIHSILLKATTAETGMEKQQICNSVKGKMGPKDVE